MSNWEMKNKSRDYKLIAQVTEFERRRLHEEAKLKLTQELATNESKLNDLQTSLTAALTERNRRLKEQVSSEGHRLRYQISSLMEENKQLNETHGNAKKQFQITMTTLEEQVKEHTSNEKRDTFTKGVGTSLTPGREGRATHFIPKQIRVLMQVEGLTNDEVKSRARDIHAAGICNMLTFAYFWLLDGRVQLMSIKFDCYNVYSRPILFLIPLVVSQIHVVVDLILPSPEPFCQRTKGGGGK
ncbi:hypothetical protein L1987_43688 [Smallanthus sonchifolius]|uniref:Uncharacterized protein n=1 Tax=Smallanthus sonchifolius TaxID=185202 RepID=A0ACB9GNK3_9ASTR|nr:hypothetical protein L1987_43688 [Smallanthus sonchifolius]